MIDCLIAFGANEGDTKSNFRRAIDFLRAMDGIEVIAVGEPSSTEPIGGPEGQSEYLNASIRLATELSANELHQRMVEIETKLGRERRVRWGSRKIDLDLLLYGDQVIRTETLTVPHSRMSFRRFVLEPCLGIAGDMTHPTSSQTIAQLLGHLDRKANLVVWVNAPTDFERSFQDLVANRDDLAEWEFAQAATLSQLKEVESTAKLMVVFGAEDSAEGSSEDSNNSLAKQALKFGGPMLDLRSSSDPLEEISAALKAAM